MGQVMMMDKIKIILKWVVLISIAVLLSFAMVQGSHALADWLWQSALTP